MSISKKILQGWGYTVGPFPPSVVLNYDGTNYTIGHWPTANPPTIAEIEAVVLPVEQEVRPVSPYDFQMRFTDAELVEIQTSVDPLVIRGRTKLQTITTFVDLNLPELQAFVGYLVSLGILTAARSAEILS